MTTTCDIHDSTECVHYRGVLREALAHLDALPRGICPGCGEAAPYPLDGMANPGFCSPECEDANPGAGECECGPDLRPYGVCPVVTEGGGRCAGVADHSALFDRGPVMPPGGWVAVCRECAHSNPSFLVVRPRLRYWARRHESVTRQGVTVTWWSAHRLTDMGREVMREHDGAVTPWPFEAEAIKAAREGLGWWS